MIIIGRALLQSLSPADPSAKAETTLSLGDTDEGLRQPRAGGLQPAQFFLLMSYSSVIIFSGSQEQKGLGDLLIMKRVNRNGLFRAFLPLLGKKKTLKLILP